MSKVYQLKEESFQNMDDCIENNEPDFLALVFDNNEYGRAYRSEHTSLKDSISKLLGDDFNYFEDTIKEFDWGNPIFNEFIKSNFDADEYLDLSDDSVKDLIIDKAIEIYINQQKIKNYIDFQTKSEDNFYETIRDLMKIILGEQDSMGILQCWGDLHLYPVVITFSNLIGTYTSYDKAKAKKRELLSTPYIFENTLTITEIEVE